MSVNDINSNSTIQELGLGKSVETSKDRDKPGQAEFLDLMVAQLQNQYSFKSCENEDFITQMAQFSAVSGLDKLQNSFDNLTNSLQSNQALQASTLVGRSVLVPSSQVVLSPASNVSGILDLQQSTTRLSVSIMNGNGEGELVKSMELGGHSAGEVLFVWDGTNDAGEKVPSGNYRIVAEAQGPDSSFSVGTLVNAAVESVTIGNGGQQLTLNLKDMGPVSFSEVREIK